MMIIKWSPVSFIMLILSVFGAGCAVSGIHPAATVYLNGIIYTVNGEDWHKKPAESLAIGLDGRIIFVGSDKDAKAYIGSDTVVIDLEGKVVLPGFLDTHVHPPGIKLSSMFSIFLPSTGTKEEVLGIIRDYIAANPDEDVYWGSGFSMGLGGTETMGKGPHKEWLDEINSDKPIILTSFDAHNLWLNSKAMEMNGITRDSEHATGTIHKDENGELWGTFSSTYDILLMERGFTPAQQRAALAAFHDVLPSFGYTGGHFILMSAEEAGKPRNEYLDYMREMELNGTWKMRSALLMRFQPETDFDEDLALLIKKRMDLDGSDFLKVTGAKFFVDGVVEGGTAYLSEPYANSGQRGFFLWDNDLLKQRFANLMSHGAQIYVHSIGDQATTETLDALEYAQHHNPGMDTRNTITHLQQVKDSDKLRMGEMGIIGSTQVFWHLKEPGFYYEVEELFLGTRRGEAAYPVQSLIDAGVLVTFSSDYPITAVPSPFYGLEIAVTRNLHCGALYGVTDINDIDDPLWLRNAFERISLKEAIEAFTINGAYQMFMENEIGSLDVGKWADMIIIDRDIFGLDPLDISDTVLLKTIISGQVVWSKN